MDFSGVIKTFLFILFFLTAIGFALAEGTGNINVNLPNVPSAQSNPGAFVGGLYQFSLMIAGLLAFGVIVYAGLRYTFAAGNPSTQSDARDQILQALLGILLLLGAFIVLRTINPNLVNLRLPELEKIQGRQQQRGDEEAGAGNNADQNGGLSSERNFQGGGGQFGGGGASVTIGLSDSEARQKLAAHGISVNSSPPKTSLEDIKQSTIDEVINLKKNCGCNITVNAGTEAGHASGDFSHANGYKVDLGLDSSLNNYVTKNFAFIGIRSDGAPLYQTQNGAIYAKESNHWDVLVKS